MAKAKSGNKKHFYSVNSLAKLAEKRGWNVTETEAVKISHSPADFCFRDIGNLARIAKALEGIDRNLAKIAKNTERKKRV